MLQCFIILRTYDSALILRIPTSPSSSRFDTLRTDDIVVMWRRRNIPLRRRAITNNNNLTQLKF